MHTFGIQCISGIWLGRKEKSRIKRCRWPGEDPLMIAYHDREWGRPVHDDKKHFEFLVLDCFQAGLSWKTILHRRKHLPNQSDVFCQLNVFSNISVDEHSNSMVCQTAP